MSRTFKQEFFRIYDRKIGAGEITFSQTGISKEDFTRLCTQEDFVFNPEAIERLALNMKLRGRSLYRTLILVPWAVPHAIAAMTFTFLYNANVGIINILAVKLGAITESVSWLGNIGSAFWCVVLVAIWKGIPFQMIFILAALQGIPQDVYESAEIDGAGRFQSFWRITLPIIKEPLAIATILNLIGIVSCFNTIWLMTGGGPLYSTEILYTFAYREAFINHNFGTAAAASVILFIFMAVFSGIYLRMVSEKE